MANIIQIPSIITEDYVKKYSPLPNNFDISEVRPYFNIAEQLWIIPIIGLPLYEELLDQVVKNNVTEENSTLLLMMYPYLSFAIVYEALPLISVHMSQVGLTVGKSENSEPASAKMVDYVSNRLRSTLETLKSSFKKWLNEHSDNYPLYVPDDCVCSNVSNNCECDWVLQYFAGDMNAYKNSYWFQNRNKPNTRLQCFPTPRRNVDIR